MTAQERMNEKYRELAAQYGDLSLKEEQIRKSKSELLSKIEGLNSAAPIIKEIDMKVQAERLSEAQESAKEHQEAKSL